MTTRTKENTRYDLHGRPYDPNADRNVFGQATNRDSWEYQEQMSRPSRREVDYERNVTHNRM